MESSLKISSYRELLVWQKSKALAIKIYKETKDFPADERYGLVSQLRRAGVSIPSNIAEGFMRGYLKEQIQFMRIAYGSGAEVTTQLEISRELGYISEDSCAEILSLLDEIMRMLNKLLRVWGSRR